MYFFNQDKAGKRFKTKPCSSIPASKIKDTCFTASVHAFRFASGLLAHLKNNIFVGAKISGQGIFPCGNFEGKFNIFSTPKTCGLS